MNVSTARPRSTGSVGTSPTAGLLLMLEGAQTKTTGRLGTATFSIKLDRRVLSRKSVGKRFVVASVASTPTASTALVTSFRVPAKRAGR